MKNSTTIVVPIYGDLPSLTQCIGSLVKYVDHDKHSVLLVNDIGPEADVIEVAVKKQIKGRLNFRYERNLENLGFVGTCNRAALELDKTGNDILLLNSDAVLTEGALEEMISVLHLSEKHGAVCPRSSNATIASVPFKFATSREERDPDYAYEVYKGIKTLLPRYTISPVAVGFCILISRQLIDNFGLFDPIYGLGYSEENDFCMRINKYGYSSVLANHAFAYHLESRSFTSEKKKLLVAQNEQKMLKRYPFYTDLVERYLNQYIDPVDWFADTIAGTGKVKILVNLFHLPTSFNGTSRNALSFLSSVKKHINKNKYEVVILAQEDAAVYHNLDSFGYRIVHPNKLNEIFHIGYVPSQVFHLENLLMMNQYCLKIIVSDLDIIGIRSNALLANSFDLRAIAYDSFRFSDRIVAISQATIDDTINYYDGYVLDADKFKVIHQGYPGSTFEAEESAHEERLVPIDALEKGYVLIFGNGYPHKAIKETVKALEGKIDMPIVVFGKHGTSDTHEVYYVQSGSVSDAFIEKLTKGAATIVFPSVYEGFGLPVAEAAHYGKSIIVADTDVSREVARLFKGLKVAFYNDFTELPDLVKKFLKKDKAPKTVKENKVRTIDDYNKEVIDFIEEVLTYPVDASALRERWNYFNQIREYVGSRPTVKGNLRVRATSYLRKKSPDAYNRARDVYRKYIKK